MINTYVSRLPKCNTLLKRSLHVCTTLQLCTNNSYIEWLVGLRLKIKIFDFHSIDEKYDTRITIYK